MSLDLRFARCAGRPYGLGADDPVCERRNHCERYLAMVGEDRQRFPDGYPLSVRVYSGLCTEGEDLFLMEGIK